MAKSPNAQRQAAYRARQLQDVDGTGERLNMIVDLKTKRALERLAAHYGVTKKQALTTAIEQAEKHLLDTLTPKAQEHYFDA